MSALPETAGEALDRLMDGDIEYLYSLSDKEVIALARDLYGYEHDDEHEGCTPLDGHVERALKEQETREKPTAQIIPLRPIRKNAPFSLAVARAADGREKIQNVQRTSAWFAVAVATAASVMLWIIVSPYVYSESSKPLVDQLAKVMVIKPATTEKKAGSEEDKKMRFAERFPSETDMLAWGGFKNLIQISPEVINILATSAPLMSGHREAQTFLGIGASGQRREFDLRLSLSEGVSKASSLNGTDPSTVFLYRGETRQVAKHLGIDCERCPGLIPVIYKLDLGSSEGRLLASRFEMRNKDAIYIPNKTSDEIANAMTYFKQIESTANDPMLAARTTR